MLTSRTEIAHEPKELEEGYEAQENAPSEESWQDYGQVKIRKINQEVEEVDERWTYYQATESKGANRWEVWSAWLSK